MYIAAELDVPTKSIKIEQQIVYKNTSNSAVSEIYLHDWNNSYSTKTSPLAVRFAEEFNNKFHFAKNKERGFTVVTSIKDNDQADLTFSNIKDHPDVIKVSLQKPLPSGESYSINLNYTIVLPDDKFTGNGYSKEENFNLKYWYITPAIYDGDWQYYSNKNLDDLYVPVSDITLQLTYPNNYVLVSELDSAGTESSGGTTQTTTLHGKNRVNTELVITKFSDFEFVQTDDFSIVSNLKSKNVSAEEKAIITDKITRFISDNLGTYPHEKLLVSELEYKKDPLYGLNQLPDFIRPFPDYFQYEIQLLKTSLKKYLDNTLMTNPRKDHWLKEGLQIYFLMKYVELNYPDMKLLGSLAKVWGIRSFHAADIGFNDQYNLFHMQMARTNRDQPITTAKDSLIKFNANIAGKYKAGVGLKYLDDFVNADILESSIKHFLKENQLNYTDSKAFESLLKGNTTKNIDWFFEDFINSRKKIDYKIKDVSVDGDSVHITIRNKKNSSMPISLFEIGNDSILNKTWLEGISDTETISVPKGNTDRLALNYDGIVPELNLKNNYGSLSKSIFGHKPLQARLFKDFEDPNYHQVFLMPLAEFKNIYDGLTLGAKLYNKTVLRRPFNYRFSPQYATKSKSLTGSGTLFYIQYLDGYQDLYNITYGILAKYSSFAEDAFVTRLTPSVDFYFRDKDDFRSNKSNRLTVRYLSIRRDIGDEALVDIIEPDYNIFNIRFRQSNIELINTYNSSYDLQFAKDFGKISFNYRYRKLLNSNQQFSFRFFAGAFLYNNTDEDSDYFSFALDRPTDYLFDYNYLGRSEDSGIFSQQLIIAEGGFKSMLETPFANQWMATTNVSMSIWRYIQAYGDIGLVKNKSINPKFVYDSGIRLNLVQDFFEIYFPVYSNLGWEIAQDNYDEKIRFIFTVDPQTLLGLFRRKWY
ncbi:metalloprotease [Winogradskyella sp. 3972H.M.0a.05]|uniref:metalloprotease n=1 Tax=Winogradskyella sp. 3972H.M.0a.05 TaxID=2950277 RepID=UPI00339227A7